MKKTRDQEFAQIIAEEDVNMKEWLFKYIIYWKWFVLSLLFSIPCAFLFLKFQVPQFRIQSTILIKDEKKGMGQDDLLKQLDIFSSNKIVDNEIEILKSYSLMEKVVKDFNLNITYSVQKRYRAVEIYDRSPLRLEVVVTGDLTYEGPFKISIINDHTVKISGVEYPVNKEVSTPFGIFKVSLTGINPDIKEVVVNVEPVSVAVEDLLSKLMVSASGKMSSVLVLSMENPVPTKGKDILNNLVETYNNTALEDKNKVAANTLVFIEERLKLISKELTIAEKNVEDYKSQQGIVDISAEGNAFLNSVRDNDIQLTQVKIQQSVLGGIEEYVKSKENKTGTVPATIGITDVTLLSLIQKLKDLEVQKERQIRMVKADNPIVLAMDDQIKSLKNNIAENIQSIKQNLNLTLIQLESQNKKLEGMIKTIPSKERGLVDISREQAIKNNLFTYLLQKREETALSFASAVSDSRIIDEARNMGQVKPNPNRIYMIFGLIGLVIPLLIIYILFLWNDKLQHRKDIEKHTHIPLLAELSWMEHETPFVINKMGRNVFSEQIRLFRTNLSFLSIGKDVQTILFTSTMSGEGKSFVSLNLAASLALTGKKTIILEFDMRRPKLRKALNISEDKGLSSYLIGRASLDEIILPVPVQDNLFMIQCGNVPPNPVELLLNGRLEVLIAELRTRFDHIIIDAPPIGLVTDAQILEKQADATMYILRYNFTHKESVRNVNLLHKEGKFKNLYLVFNGIKSGRSYGYGYGYGYYQEKSTTSGFLGWKSKRKK